jgi:hypothetical protein
MLCDPNGASSFHCPPFIVTFSSFVVDFHCPPLIITFSSFVVDFHCPPPIVTQCCNYVVDVDRKGKKLVDEDVIVVIGSLQPIEIFPP